MNITLCADPKNGNDAAEVVIQLPAVPRAGDSSGTTILEVTDVCFEAGEDTYPRVWVRIDGYNLEDLDEAMASLRTGYALGTSDNLSHVRAAMRWTEEGA